MKRVNTKCFVATVATILMAVSSPSVSFPMPANSSTTDLDFVEVRPLEECCASCDAYSGGQVPGSQSDKKDDSDRRVTRILTWAESKAELQAYADLYKKSHPEAPSVRIVDVPSIKELNYEVTSELRLGSTVFDGFVVPPLLMGDMLQPRSGQALAVWTEEEMVASTTTTTTNPQQQEDQPSLLDDLLPYYRYNVATYGGRLRGLPILSGSQGLILFRKDYLDALNLPTPKTWEDWTKIASEFSTQTDHPLLGAGPDKVYGACLGLLNEAGCRRRKSLNGGSCKSHTMTYVGMILASMTQYEGNSTGYMLGMDDTSPNGLDPLFEPTIERTLKWMEKHILNSKGRSLLEDSTDSMKNFRDGRCAWTISVDHDSKLLEKDNIGFVPLPGSHQVLDRGTDSMINCTAASCPYGNDFLNRRSTNQVPFGAVDATVGTVSALVSRDRQVDAKKFFKFVLASHVRQDDNGNQISQPLTYSELEQSDVAHYEKTMKSLTSSPNAAIPFWVPNAFNLLSDLDDRIYNYLYEADYSDNRREEVSRAAEKSWNMMISMYDFRRPSNRQSTSYLYEVSMGLHASPPTSDFYIGWLARGVMWSIAALSCLGSICSALWVLTYQRERVIRASQPVFLYLICAGTFVMALSVFTLGIEDDIAPAELTSITCMANYWLYSLGFTAVISALFSKMWMLGQVFQKPRNEQRIQVKKLNILFPFFIFFGLDCIVLSVWTILDRQKWVRMPVYYNDPYSPTVGWCVSDHSTWYIGLLLVINIAILILSLVQSYECRRITTEYKESSWVTIAIATTAQAWFISLPLLMLLDDNPTWWFILTSSTVLCTTIPILVLIFVPKMLYSYAALKKSTNVRVSVEETKRKLFDDNIEKSQDLKSSDFASADFTVAESVESTRGSSHTLASQRRQDPKGTIGIRIIQFTYLDSDQVDELEDAVDFAAQRNKELKETIGRLRDNIEEHHFSTRNRMYAVPRYSFKSKAQNSDTSIITGADIASIIEAKPESRHSRRSRRETFLS